MTAGSANSHWTLRPPSVGLHGPVHHPHAPPERPKAVAPGNASGHQRLQAGHQRRVVRLQTLPPASRGTNTLLARRQGWRRVRERFQIMLARDDSLSQNAGRLGDRSEATMSQRLGFGCCPQPSHPLIHHRGKSSYFARIRSTSGITLQNPAPRIEIPVYFSYCPAPPEQGSTSSAAVTRTSCLRAAAYTSESWVWLPLTGGGLRMFRPYGADTRTSERQEGSRW